MDAVMFNTEARRMCKESISCSKCAAGMGEDCALDVTLKWFDPAEAVRIVEEWSNEHPIQTNAQKFEEVFGFKPYTDMKWAAANDEYAAELHDTVWWDMPYEAPKGE